MNATAQDCIDTAFKANYYVSNSRLTLNNQQANVSGEHFIVGRVNFLGSSQVNNFITKINTNGTIAFDKQLIFSDSFDLGVRSLSLMLQNGNFLMASNIVGFNAVPDSFLRVIKFNGSGNIVFAKKYFALNGCNSPISIAEADNGSIVVLFSYENDVNNIFKTNGVLKIDSLGNILWSNLYQSTLNSELYGQSLSVLNNRIYINGFFFDTGFPFNPLFEHRLFLAKIDLMTGNLIDSKSYNDKRVQDNLPIIRYWGSNYASQISTKNGQILYTNRFENATNSKQGGISSLSDTNLNFIRAIYFSVPTIYGQCRIMGNEDGEIFNYGNIYTGGILNRVYIAKFDSGGNKQREISLNYTTATQYQASPVRPISLLKKYLSVFNTYVQGNETYLQLYKFPADVPISECYGRDTSLVTSVNYNITPVYQPFLNQVTSLTLSAAPLNVTLSSLGLIAEKQCTVISDCNFLKLNPSINKFCSVKDTFNFSAHKNIACNKNILWQIDTAAYSFLQVVNDSTVRIKFKQAWSGYLYSKISSCSVLKDSIFLTVYNTPDNIGISNDTSLCAAQTIMLQPKTGYANYLWENGSTIATRLIQSAGQYSIIVHDYCNNTFYDTINVRYYQPVLPVNLGSDTTLCKGNTLQVQVGAGFKNIQWQDASANQNFTISNAGKYFVTATDSCGNIFSDTINVKYYVNRPPVNLGADITACKAQNNVLNAGTGYKKYSWQDGSTNNSFTASVAGTYYVDVTDSCGNKSTDTLYIKPETPFTLKIDYLQPICINDTATIKLSSIFSGYDLNVTNTAFIQNNTLKLFPRESSTYTVTALTPAGCFIEDTLLIKIKYCSDVIYFPSAFTPNGNGNNDYYTPLCETIPIFYEFKIYNRYGQNIFVSKDIKKGWDGKFKTVLQNTGSFVWSCRFQFYNKSFQYKSGTILLIR